MNTQARMILGVLAVLVLALALALGVVVAMDDDDDDGTMAGRSQMAMDDSYAGMMQSMGDMDSGAMLSDMREILGASGFQQMMDHMSDHRAGEPMTDDPNVDQMMHDMMDGMMQHMPADGSDIMPPGVDSHHETPTTATTPVP